MINKINTKAGMPSNQLSYAPIPLLNFQLSIVLSDCVSDYIFYFIK